MECPCHSDLDMSNCIPTLMSIWHITAEKIASPQQSGTFDDDDETLNLSTIYYEKM